MKIVELFKNYTTVDLTKTKNLKPDWDKIRTIPPFAVLEHTQQNTDFHKEGNVWEHTKLVGNAMYDILNDKWNYRTDILFPDNPMINMCLIAAAICHDLGKAGHTTFDEKDQQWHCNRHGFYGEQITRVLFYDENPLVREAICALVKSHMIFHHLLDDGKEDKVENKLIELSWSNVPISMHLLIHIADCLGTVNEDMLPSKINEHINKLITTFKQYSINLYEHYRTYNFRPADRFKKFLPGGDTISDEVLKDADLCRMQIDCKYKPALHMMIGFPGSGKDTYINAVLMKNVIKDETVILCRDDIRQELGIIQNNYEKKNGSKEQENQVTEIFNNRLNDAIVNRKTIIINNTNLLKKYRESFVVPALKAGYRIIYHIVETPDTRECIQRRIDTIPMKVMNRMIENFEFPTLRECLFMVIHKQSFDEVMKDYIVDDYVI